MERFKNDVLDAETPLEQADVSVKRAHGQGDGVGHSAAGFPLAVVHDFVDLAIVLRKARR